MEFVQDYDIDLMSEIDLLSEIHTRAVFTNGNLGKKLDILTMQDNYSANDTPNSDFLQPITA